MSLLFYAVIFSYGLSTIEKKINLKKKTISVNGNLMNVQTDIKKNSN